MRRQKGFTIMELSVVMAMIATLAALCVPAYMHYKKQSLRAEPPSVLGAITAAQMQHKLRFGAFVPCKANPPGPGARWDREAPGWKELDFTFVGEPMFRYAVAADASGFTVTARGNIDTDPETEVWQAASRHIEPFCLKRD